VSKSTATAIAARYATAIFALATEAKKPELVVDELSAIAAAIDSSAELKRALTNPLLARATKAELLLALAKKGHKTTLQSLKTLAEKGRAALLPQVAAALRTKLLEAQGTVVAEIESARPLSPAMQQQLADSIARATGKTVQLHLKENPELLGGVAIQIGSKRLDASLSAALTTMRRQLLATTA
jgi:F-type H+-transporting ATPase subunit delta